LVVVTLSVTGMTTTGGSRTVGAQDAATPTSIPFATAPTVSVTGTGRVTVEPDTASITLGVAVFEANLSEAQAKATTQMTTIIDAVEGAGIADEDIQTSNYSVNVRQDYDENGNPTKVIGYDINNTVTVTVRDLDALGSILDSVVQAGANTIYGISFFTEDMTEATAQARAAAVADARVRADQLADAAGASVGRVIAITEGYSAPPSPVYYDRSGGADMAMAESAPVPVQVGTQQIEVQVSVVYELEQ
jgi:hypothetical protein